MNIERNRKRDAQNPKRLHRLGWSSMTVWECHPTRSRIEASDRASGLAADPNESQDLKAGGTELTWRGKFWWLPYPGIGFYRSQKQLSVNSVAQRAVSSVG